MILIFILHALFATVFPLTRIAVQSSGPIFFTGMRMTLSGIILLIYEYTRGTLKFDSLKANFFKILLLALFNIFLTNVPEFWSLQFITSGKAVFIYSLCPFISAIFDYFLLKQKITWKQLVGMLIGSLGFLIVLIRQNKCEQELGGLLFLSWPEIAMVVAALSTVYGWIVMRQLMKTNEITSITANGSSMLLGGIMAFITSPFLERWNPVPVCNIPTFIYTLLLISLISNFICYNLYGYLLKKYSATLVSFVGFTQLIFATAYGRIFLGEQVAPYFIVASCVIFVALYIFYSEELKQGNLYN